MNCILMYPDSHDLTPNEIAGLWAQGVNMDDWDFFLAVPPDQVEEYETTDSDWVEGRWQDAHVKRLRPIEFVLERFQVGCCDNRWYRATFRGQAYAILVAYHA